MSKIHLIIVAIVPTLQKSYEDFMGLQRAVKLHHAKPCVKFS